MFLAKCMLFTRLDHVSHNFDFLKNLKLQLKWLGWLPKMGVAGAATTPSHMGKKQPL